MDWTDDLLRANDAELGRIFREVRERCATVEKAYLKNDPPTAQDFRQAALESLAIIGDGFREARDVEASSAQGDLPEPLNRLMLELATVAQNMPSVLLSPNNARKNKGRASNNLWGVHVLAAAIGVHDALIEFGRPADQAAKDVAKCFQARGVKINGNSVTAAKVKEWSNERGRAGLHKLVTKQLAELDKRIEELRNWGHVRPVAEVYATVGYYQPRVRRVILDAFCIPSNADRAEMLLDWLRNFIHTTACD